VPILHDYEYFKPTGIRETLNLLAEYKQAAVLAGGTDLVVNLKENATAPPAVIDIKGLSELNRIEYTNQRLSIGALATFTTLTESDIVATEFPLIAETALTVGSTGIRNRATLAGNICSAVPCMDSGPLLLVYEAEIIVTGAKGERKIPVSDWFRGPRETALKQGEFVTRIDIPRPADKHAGCYVKLGRYKGEDLAQASVAVLVIAEHEYRVAFGAVAPIPVRSTKIETLLNGRQPDQTLIAQVRGIIPDEIMPITDIRASREYRLHMSQVMFERGLNTAWDRLSGTGPPYGSQVI
jgi:carbon-monoxide dehydrogenase medium subunit